MENADDPGGAGEEGEIQADGGEVVGFVKVVERNEERHGRGYELPDPTEAPLPEQHEPDKGGDEGDDAIATVADAAAAVAEEACPRAGTQRRP